MKPLTIFIFITLSIVIQASKKSKLQQTYSSSQATALSLGNDYTQATINSTSIATKGNKGTSVSVANATTDNVNNLLHLETQADATNDQYVKNSVYINKDLTYLNRTQNSNGLSTKTYQKNQYSQNSSQVLTEDNQNLGKNAQSFQNSIDTYGTNGRQTITDSTGDRTTLTTHNYNDNSQTYFEFTDEREITITIDAGNEKLIFEKIIGNDDRVMILTAAKYLRGFSDDVKAYFQKLFQTPCNCKQVRQYAINLLAEGN
jgi:hypothetical protein